MKKFWINVVVAASLVASMGSQVLAAFGPTSTLYVTNYGEFSGGAVTGLDLIQGVHERGNSSHGGIPEETAHGKPDTESLAQEGDELHGDQRVTSDVEEVLVRPDLGPAEELAEDLRDRLFPR